MSTTAQELDPTLSVLQDFIATRFSDIAEDEAAVGARILKPVRLMKSRRKSRRALGGAIVKCRALAEQVLRETCAAHSIDFWLAHIRKLPLLLKEWPDSWLPYATLAVLKWSNWSEDTNASTFWSGRSAAVTFLYTDADLLSCIRIATVSRLMAESNNIARWLAKGASYTLLSDGQVQSEIPQDVSIAVAEYERRRPDASLFADEGILVDNTLPNLSQYLSSPLISLGEPRPPLDRAVIQPTHEEFPIRYFPKARSTQALFQTLGPYSDALEEKYGIDAAGIADVLHAISMLIIRTIPASDSEHELAFESSLADSDFLHAFSFMLGLCRRGFVRFPEEDLRTSIALQLAAMRPERADQSAHVVDTFFQAFCLRAAQAGQIDVSTLTPLPVLFTSPGDQCYLDLLWIDDFLRSLVVASREWFSTQHGDRFTLALKRSLAERVHGLRVVSFKKEYSLPSGDKCEVDLLLQKSGVLYVVECKAYAKSREFWLGDIEATNRRTQKIAEATAQARRATSIVRELGRSGHPEISEAASVEWVVCFPSQEYLRPVDRYGYLSGQIPRVCTPEELAMHLGQKQEEV